MMATARRGEGRLGDERPRSAIWWASTLCLVCYLGVGGLYTAFALVQLFPTSEAQRIETTDVDGVAVEQVRPIHTFEGRTLLFTDFEPSIDQGLLLIAVLAGALGAFVHAAHSFVAFVGNRRFMPSWLLWYVFRLPIGAALGLLLYFVVRAGLLGGNVDSVSPYGVAAFASLAGLFSKQAIDKLAEVFETIFRTRRSAPYGDGLASGGDAPSIARVEPDSPLPLSGDGAPLRLTVHGKNFRPDSYALVGSTRFDVALSSSQLLHVSVASDELPADPQVLELRIVNPTPATVKSEPFTLEFGSRGAGTGL